MSHNLEDIGQVIDRVPSYRELEFMNSVAIPRLDETNDEKTLEDLAETFWNLCLWEKGRADILDTKASYLVGLSSITAAVVAVGGVAGADMGSTVLIAIGVSLALFAITVVLSLFALGGKKYGAFLDKDVFGSLHAHEAPIGKIKAFEDKDPRRCFIREIILQRWLIYRWHHDANDQKYNQLVHAQVSAVISVCSLLAILVVVFFVR